MEENKVVVHVAQSPIIGASPTVGEVADKLNATYEQELDEKIRDYKEVVPNKDFYIEKITRRDAKNPLNFTAFNIGHTQCPSPRFDQHVWKYYHRDDKKKLLWTVPDVCHAMLIRENPMLLDASHEQLTKWALDFWDGTLHKRMRAENGEKELEHGAPRPILKPIGHNILKGDTQWWKKKR